MNKAHARPHLAKADHGLTDACITGQYAQYDFLGMPCAYTIMQDALGAVKDVDEFVTDLHSATKPYLEGWDFLKTYTWLLAIFSWAIRTFSLPLITK